MKIVVGMHDLDGGAIVTAVAFEEWDSAEAAHTFTSRVAPVGAQPARCS